MLQVEKIAAREEFEALAPEWNPLLQSSAANTIALTHEWLTTWWDVFGEDRALCILVVREAGKLIGIAPLLKRRVSQFGIATNRLEFLASGEEEADEICSDYLDFIVKTGREGEVLQALLRFLLEAETDWDEIVLTEMRADSPTLEILKDLEDQSDLKTTIEEIGESVYLSLEQGWDNVLAALPGKLRYQIRRHFKTAQENDWRLRVVTSADEWQETFPLFVNLHQSVWTARGEPGVFASEKFTRFHRQLAAQLLPKGQVCLYFLQHDGEKENPMAGLYTFVYNGKAFFYQAGYRADSPVHSPGTLARNMAIQNAIESGLKEWDFLKAEPNTYKYRYDPKIRRLAQARLAKLQVKEAMLSTAHRLAGGLRHARQQAKSHARRALTKQP